MRDLIAKLLLIIYCFFSLLFSPMNATFVAGLFVIISVSCLLTVFSQKKLLWILTILFFTVSFFFPVLCIFYPVLFFHLVGQKSFLLCGSAVCILLLLQFSTDKVLFLFTLLGCLTAAFLSLQNLQLTQLEQALIHTQDDSKEKNLLLFEKNQHLIERQNQEIYAATLKERNRIAREIHDHVGHMLSRAILMVGALKAINKQENLHAPLEQLSDTLDQAMNNVRTSVHDLHDDSVDLRAVLEDLTVGFTKCRCELSYDMSRFIPKDIKYSIIAIVKEALANIMRHSDATFVHIRVLEHPGLYQLIIDDNGVCNIPDDVFTGNSTRTGMGLTNMRDRVQSLHGTIRFRTTDGFHIFITFRKEENHDSNYHN